MGKTRTFIAVPLSEAIRGRLDSLRRELSRCIPDCKWTEPENLHVTLVFLGEVDDRELAQVCGLTRQAALEISLTAFPMTVAGVGCFGDPFRPRTLWVGVGEGHEELELLHAALEEQFATLGYRHEERPFAPHVTLGRNKSGAPHQETAAAIAARETWEAGRETVREVHVMGSELTPKGPAYTVIGRVKLVEEQA